MPAYNNYTYANAPLYLQSKSYDAKSDRKVLADVASAGVVGANDMLVTVPGTPSGLTLNVAGGVIYVLGGNVADQGMYRLYDPTTRTITCPAADATNPRIDTIIMRVYDNAVDVSGYNEARVEVIPGTPTGGATLGNLNGKATLASITGVSLSYFVLAYVLVPATATVFTNSVTNVSDVRTRATVGSGSAAGPTSGMTVATTIGGLGTAINGKMGRLRLGSTPYTFVMVVYDSTYAKWISEPSLSLVATHGTTSTTSATYVDVIDPFNTGLLPGFVIPGWRDYDAGGLLPQSKWSAAFTNTTSTGNGSMTPSFGGYDDGSTWTGTVVVTVASATGEAVQNCAVTGQPYLRGTVGWAQIAGGYTLRDNLLAGYRLKTAAGNISVKALGAVRWVG